MVLKEENPILVWLIAHQKRSGRATRHTAHIVTAHPPEQLYSFIPTLRSAFYCFRLTAVFTHESARSLLTMLKLFTVAVVLLALAACAVSGSLHGVCAEGECTELSLLPGRINTNRHDCYDTLPDGTEVSF